MCTFRPLLLRPYHNQNRHHLALKIQTNERCRCLYCRKRLFRLLRMPSLAVRARSVCWHCKASDLIRPLSTKLEQLHLSRLNRWWPNLMWRVKREMPLSRSVNTVCSLSKPNLNGNNTIIETKYHNNRTFVFFQELSKQQQFKQILYTK